MKKYLFLVFFLVTHHCTSYAQQGWAMLKGEASSYFPVRGVKGQPDEKNTLGRYAYGATWSYQGSLYLYGSFNKSFDGNNSVDYTADMWRYDTLTHNWTWISGPGDVHYFVINPQYGTKRKANANNHPGSRYDPVTWVLNGKLYLFGGNIYDKNNHNYKNDLWEYDPVTNMWTWLHEGTDFSIANFGVQGIPAITNCPEGLKDGYGWVRNGRLYFYGGGFNQGLRYNDIWEYNPDNYTWTWIKGDGRVGVNGHWGTKNVTNVADVPAGGEKAAWYISDKLYVSTDRGDELWVYDHTTNNWTWIKGDTTAKPAVFGTKGAGVASNTPGDRETKAYWEHNGKLYQLSGSQEDVLWELDPSTNNWTWVSGDTIARKTVFGTYMQADTNVLPANQALQYHGN